MAESVTIDSILADPRQGRWVVILGLTLLSGVAIVLRWSLDFDGVLDTDVLNFGLAAIRFDVLDHQPHPPGYPGYVVVLKFVHLIAPWLDPIAVAKWTTRLCGVGITVAAYWACSEALGGGVDGRSRALVAAALSVLHPILWFYGGDGQSHGAEGLLALLLFALCARGKRKPTRLKLLLIVAAFAFSGSVRPTLPLLLSPLLLWLFWRRPILDWLLAVMVGTATIASWYSILIVASGGLELYARASKALVGDMFIASYSVFGKRSSFRGVSANLVSTLWAFLFSIVPLIALGSVTKAWSKPWFRAIVAVCGFNLVFFTLMFSAEFGYLIQVAAFSVLVPATWPFGSSESRKSMDNAENAARSRSLWLRLLLTAIVCPLLFFAGPQSVPIPYSVNALAPTYPRIINQAGEQRIYRELMCGLTEGETTLLLSDNYVTTNNRWLTMVCPQVVVGVFLHDLSLNLEIDNWLFLFSDHMDSVPPEVPLEPGKASTYNAPSVVRVAVALDASKELAIAIHQSASCPPMQVTPYGPSSQISVWPARCFDKLQFGAHTIIISASGEPHFGEFFPIISLNQWPTR